MISDNYKNLLKKLTDKTELGSVIWNKTSNENEFKLDLEKGAITVDKFYHEGLFYTDFTIYNDRGEQIDRLEFQEGDTDFNLLTTLHDSARRTYYKVDSTIKNIFDELDKNKIIGKKNIIDPNELNF